MTLGHALFYSLCHSLLQSPASYPVHVWSAGYPQHRRAASPSHRLSQGQIHQRNQRWSRGFNVCLLVKNRGRLGFIKVCFRSDSLSRPIWARVTGIVHVTTTLSNTFFRFKGGGDALWDHAEEVPCLQRDPSACQPSNVSQPLGVWENRRLLAECVDGRGSSEHSPKRMPSPVHQTHHIMADSSDNHAASISHPLLCVGVELDFSNLYSWV